MSLIYDCRECSVDEERKKAYGCEVEAERPLWETDYCFVCRGTDNSCEYCDGSNKMQVFKCPRKMANEVAEIIPYFADWRVSNRIAWPDGQGRLHQPCKLTEAFDLLDDFVHRIIDESKSTSSS